MRSEVDHKVALDVTHVETAHSRRTVGWYTPVRCHRAGFMCATETKHVNHAPLRMSLAVNPYLATFYVKVRLCHARGMRATLVADVHHTLLSMLLAVHRELAAVNVETRPPRAGLM